LNEVKLPFALLCSFAMTDVFLEGVVMPAKSLELSVLSPFSREILESLPYDTPQEIEDWLIRAHRLSRQPRSRLSVCQRISILEKAQSFVEKKFDRIVMTATQEGGKPLRDSRIEIERGIQGIRTAIESLKSMGGEEVPMGLTPASEGRWAFTRREPVGIVLAVSAFNHPFNLIIHQVIPAVAVGCPVLVKPARQTPLSCRRLIEILYDAGLPEEWCRMVICDHQMTENLVKDQRLSHFNFIGSAEVGWKLRSLLAPGVTSTLEHGGAAPVIICEDVKFDEAIPLLLKGGFYHAGQVCVSVQRIFVHESKARNFAEQLARGAKNLKVGDPLDEATEVGPMIEPKEVRRIDDWVNEAVQTGAQLLGGGQVLAHHCYSPTVLFNPPEATRITRQEVFGPVVAIYPFKNIEEAIQRANHLPFAFQSAVFTENIHLALKCCRELDATTVMVNDHTAFRVDWMPFGGRRQSGVGVGGIPYSMKELTFEKLLVWKSPELM
jgi:acyl-CoA reductase-like NAD-dependent aldehyde dehydrogenase